MSSSMPDIFKLNVDCFDEIFEYLSLCDLHSIAETCKALQKVAGKYYERNYYSAKMNFGATIYPYFKQYAQHVIFDSSWNGFDGKSTSIKHLQVSNTPFTILTSENSLKALTKLEILELKDFRITQTDIYGRLLETFKNLKRFSLHTNFTNLDKKWLQRNYPRLVSVELLPRVEYKTDEIVSFLVSNPQIQSFSTNLKWIWANKTKLLQTNIKLDELRIKHLCHGDINKPKLNLNDFFGFLDQLFERGFYKKLHFHYGLNMEQSLSNQLLSLRNLEKLSIFEIECNFNQMNNLRELTIFDCYAEHLDLDDLPDKLVNLERIHLQWVSYKNILPFIFRSRNLMKMKIMARDKDLKCFNGGVINLVQLNEEREKLNGAKKLMIYLDDEIFLATKWNTPNGNINLDLIEMRRFTSHCWNYR